MRLPRLSPLFILLPAAAWAGTSVSGTPKVAFHAEGSPGFLDIEGTTSQLRVEDDGTTLTFTVPLESVTTGIGVRDHHMKETYAHVAQYPDALLTLPRSAVHWPAAVGEATSGDAAGSFRIHGVTQPADVVYTLKKTKAGTRITASFEFDVTQHGIAIPSYLGVTVDPKMKAEATFDLAAP